MLAHGRDPHFAGWPDTLQLDHHHAGMRAALLETLLGVAAQCDRVRCDMAVLLLPDVVRHSWGEPARPADAGAPVETSFWPEAIASVRARRPGFVFIPEAYGGSFDQVSLLPAAARSPRRPLVGADRRARRRGRRDLAPTRRLPMRSPATADGAVM